jgi:DNA polymerase III delta prime subunit
MYAVLTLKFRRLREETAAEKQKSLALETQINVMKNALKAELRVRTGVCVLNC